MNWKQTGYANVAFWFYEIFEEGRRGLAKKYHPDKPGGDAQKMQQINTVVDRMVQGR